MSQRRIPPGFNINPDATTSDTYRRSARTFPIAASPNTPRQRTVRTYTAPPNSRWERGQAAETRRSAGSSMDLGTTEGVSRSVTTSTSASGSHVNSTSNTGPRCFRITGIPLSWSENDLFRALHDADASLTRQNFQPSLNPGCSGSTQTALLNLDPSTERLQRRKYLQVPQSGSRAAALLSIDNQFYYLTPLNNPRGEVLADVIAVTGLAGHAFGSWRSRETLQMWLKDFLPYDIPNIRIMTYGYDSSLVGNSRTNSRLLDYQRSFTQEIENARSSIPQTRPIIFIGHSLGGILIMQALIEAKRNSSHSHILYAMKSIMFFGTPHQGLRTYDLEEMVDAESGGYETSKHNLLKQLREGAEFLEVQKEELTYIWEEYKPKIVSFYETAPTPTVRRSNSGGYERSGEESEMVKRFSAQLFVPSEQRVPVDQSHSNMVKFASPVDPTYRTVVRYLQMWVNSK